jgi:hypothetical protein
MRKPNKTVGKKIDNYVEREMPVLFSVRVYI